jgi:hypothetical protein
MRELFANDPSQCGKKRLLVDMGHQRIVDQGLVITAACRFGDRAKMIENRVVEAN